MSWTDVLVRINFWAPGGPGIVNGLTVSEFEYRNATAFSPAQKQAIISALEQLYAGSPTAAWRWRLGGRYEPKRRDLFSASELGSCR